MEKTQPTTTKEKETIISMFHDPKIAGHKGVAKTVELITRHWEWPGLNKDVSNYISHCDLCQRTKVSRHRPYGKLQSFTPPAGAWEEITMDFIGPLPESMDPASKTKYDMIYVVLDKLTKYARFIPTRTTNTAPELAYIFMRDIFAHHGMPSRLISDRDKLFKSKFWTSLMDQLGGKNKLSTAFPPQTDGQTERTNQILEQYLRAYVNYEQTNWVELLPKAQFAYNNSTSATGISPFYGQLWIPPKNTRRTTEKCLCSPKSYSSSGQA